eukprot:CAMPEP_0194152742 /NCGR_PEP_ID=MMETSP0152-20130528/53728_1 /TAXON_ID=1049557 /ORGANISM="Thalassiothrix antarctica, Strain L6-D1" /LENGTH=38 /DNA_ID= /DNA_START= /DNA_END= /DNA_ORIENTATION=
MNNVQKGLSLLWSLLLQTSTVLSDAGKNVIDTIRQKCG